MFVRAAARLRPVLVFALLVTLLSSLVAPASARPAAPAPTGAPADATPDLKSEWDEILGQEAGVVRALGQSQARREKLTRAVAALDGQIAATQDELTKAQFVLTGANKVADHQRFLLSKAQHRVDIATHQLHRQIISSFVAGGQEGAAIFVLLQASNGEEAGQAVAYSNALVTDTDHYVKALDQARAQQRKADHAARHARHLATKRRDQVNTAKEAIQKSRDDQQHLVDQVDKEVLIQTDLLRAVQGKKALVQGRIDAETHASDGIALILAARQVTEPDWKPGSVEITSPLPGVAVSSGFGMRHHPILNIDRLHAGDDLGAPTGTPIHAAANGIVVLAEARGGYGNATVIDHGHSLATLYGHQSRIIVTPGQLVRRGEVIGYVGSTGLSTGPHCHFETRVRGVPIDPEGVVDFSFVPDYDALLKSYAQGN